jgi:hypothetical protein
LAPAACPSWNPNDITDRELDRPRAAEELHENLDAIVRRLASEKPEQATHRRALDPQAIVDLKAKPAGPTAASSATR